MKYFLLSWWLQFVSMPILASQGPAPVSWIYGLPDASPRVAVGYAPQIQLHCRLTLKPVADVEGDTFYVEDVAECTGPLQLCREVLGVALGPSPKPGLRSRVMADTLGATLREEFPQHSFDIEGATQVEIRAMALPVDADRLRATLEQRLAAYKGSFRVIVRSLRVSSQPKLRHPHYEFEFPDLDAELQRLEQFPRKTFLSLRTQARENRSPSTPTFEWTTHVSVRLDVEALVAQRALARGQLLQDADVVLRWLPYQENLVRDPRQIQSKSLRLAIREGQPLRSFDLYQEPDVRRGERVGATVLSGGVKMNSGGQAMESGTVGQKVRVQLDSTKRQVMGLIVARSQVEVHLP